MIHVTTCYKQFIANVAVTRPHVALSNLGNVHIVLIKG